MVICASLILIWSATPHSFVCSKNNITKTTLWSLLCKPFVSQTYRGTRGIQIPFGRWGGGPEGYVIFANLTFDINSSANEHNFIYLFSDEFNRRGQISKFFQEFTFRDKSLPLWYFLWSFTRERQVDDTRVYYCKEICISIEKQHGTVLFF